MKLYDFEEFRENGLELAFLKADDVIYPQFGKEFDPNLSIIDVMIFFSFLDWSIVVIIVVNSWTGNPVVYPSEEIGCNNEY